MQTSQHLNKPKTFLRATSRQRIIAAGVVLGAIIIFGGFALAGHYKIYIWPFGCGFRQRYGLPCPTCGFTTAAVAFSQGKIFKAFYIQPAAAFICLILASSALLALFIAVSGIYFRFIDRFLTEIKLRYIILVLIIIIAAGWAVTLAQAIAAKMKG